MDFQGHFVTVDESWIQQYMPDENEQFKQWIEAAGSTPKKVKSIALAASVFLGLQWSFVDQLSPEN